MWNAVRDVGGAGEGAGRLGRAPERSAARWRREFGMRGAAHPLLQVVDLLVQVVEGRRLRGALRTRGEQSERPRGWRGWCCGGLRDSRRTEADGGVMWRRERSGRQRFAARTWLCEQLGSLTAG